MRLIIQLEPSAPQLGNHRSTTPRRKTNVLLRAVYYICLLGGITALGYTGYVVADAHFSQAAASRELAREWAAPRDTSGARRVLAEGDAIGEMQIARVGLRAIFFQGDSDAILQRAIGHLPQTAMPGEPGNVVLAGHRDTFFRPVRDIELGDEITLKTLGGDFLYKVESIRIVAPSDVWVLNSTGVRTLTLVTCYPFGYVGAAPNRFIVRARQIGSDAPLLPSVNSHHAEAPQFSSAHLNDFASSE